MNRRFESLDAESAVRIPCKANGLDPYGFYIEGWNEQVGHVIGFVCRGISHKIMGLAVPHALAVAPHSASPLLI